MGLDRVPNLKFSLRPRRRGAFIIRLDCGTIMAVKQDRSRSARPPLDAAALEQAALAYAGRYATTRARLRAYLVRKLRERGWAEARRAAGRRAGRAAWRRSAMSTTAPSPRPAAAALGRRGYGARRVGDGAARGRDRRGGCAPRRAAARRDGAWEAALALRRAPADRAVRRRARPIGRRAKRRSPRCCAPAIRPAWPGASSARRPGEIPDADSVLNRDGSQNAKTW